MFLTYKTITVAILAQALSAFTAQDVPQSSSDFALGTMPSASKFGSPLIANEAMRENNLRNMPPRKLERSRPILQGADAEGDDAQLHQANVSEGPYSGVGAEQDPLPGAGAEAPNSHEIVHRLQQGDHSDGEHSEGDAGHVPSLPDSGSEDQVKEYYDRKDLLEKEPLLAKLSALELFHPELKRANAFLSMCETNSGEITSADLIWRERQAIHLSTHNLLNNKYYSLCKDKTRCRNIECMRVHHPIVQNALEEIYKQMRKEYVRATLSSEPHRNNFTVQCRHPYCRLVSCNFQHLGDELPGGMQMRSTGLSTQERRRAYIAQQTSNPAFRRALCTYGVKCTRFPECPFDHQGDENLAQVAQGMAWTATQREARKSFLQNRATSQRFCTEKCKYQTKCIRYTECTFVHDGDEDLFCHRQDVAQDSNKREARKAFIDANQHIRTFRSQKCRHQENCPCFPNCGFDHEGDEELLESSHSGEAAAAAVAVDADPSLRRARLMYIKGSADLDAPFLAACKHGGKCKRFPLCTFWHDNDEEFKDDIEILQRMAYVRKHRNNRICFTKPCADESSCQHYPHCSFVHEADRFVSRYM